jgi:hypothetical protein
VVVKDGGEGRRGAQDHVQRPGTDRRNGRGRWTPFDAHLALGNRQARPAEGPRARTAATRRTDNVRRQPLARGGVRCATMRCMGPTHPGAKIEHPPPGVFNDVPGRRKARELRDPGRDRAPLAYVYFEDQSGRRNTMHGQIYLV